MSVSFWQGFKRYCCYRHAVFALLAITTSAHAASIVVLPLGADQPSLVVVNGRLNLGDEDEFLRQIASVSRAIVAFESDGGSLLAGLQIGETIRLKNFSTLVADKASCASSCALAWLGGTRRFMGAHAQVGFHAAYDGNTHQVTSSGNALVGAYLNKIGLPSSAVIYITSASPDSVTWLSKTDAEKLGIEVSLYSSPTDTKPPPPSGPKADDSATWGAHFLSQVQRCWKKPYAGVEVQKVEAAFEIRLKRDGTLDGPPVPGGSPTTPYLRLYQQSALRAIVGCQPYKLPQEYFDEWKYFAPVFSERRN
jgi:hypothetical protein